jgi:hypothetical protein
MLIDYATHSAPASFRRFVPWFAPLTQRFVRRQ